MAVPAELSADDVVAALRQLPGWSGDVHGIKRHLVFEEFRGAMAFMQSCVEEIEMRNHHPVWTNKYNSLDIHLDTFDVGHKVTAKDIELATFFSEVLATSGSKFGLVEDE